MVQKTSERLKMFVQFITMIAKLFPPFINTTSIKGPGLRRTIAKRKEIHVPTDEGKETILLLSFHKTPDIFLSSEKHRYFTNVLTNFNRSGTSRNILKILRFFLLRRYTIIVFLYNNIIPMFNLF